MARQEYSEFLSYLKKTKEERILSHKRAYENIAQIWEYSSTSFLSPIWCTVVHDTNTKL